MLIQILGIFLLFIILSRVYNHIQDKTISVPSFILWALIFGSILLVVIDPEISSKLAKFLGIQRGADVVVYGSILLLFFLVFRLTVVIENIEHRQVQIIQNIAISKLFSNNENETIFMVDDQKTEN